MRSRYWRSWLRSQHQMLIVPSSRPCFCSSESRHGRVKTKGIYKCRSVLLPVDNRPDSALSMLVLTPRTSIFSHADSYDSQRGLTHHCTGLLLAFANARPMELHYCRLLPRLISSSGYCSNTPHLEQSFGYLATPILLVTTCYAYKNSLAFWQTFDR